MPSNESAPDCGPNQKLNSSLRIIFFSLLVLLAIPVLKAIQYRYFPAMTEFSIVSVREVVGPYELVVRTAPVETVTVSDGFLLDGVLDKSILYPKWACAYESTDVTQISDVSPIQARATIIFGDQPRGSGITRRIGRQLFNNWYVEKSIRLGEVYTLFMDIQHRCFGVFVTLTRLEIVLDMRTGDTAVRRIRSLW